MKLRELLHRSHPNAFKEGSSRYIPLQTPNVEENVFHGLVIQRLPEKGTFGIFRPHDIFFVRQSLVDAGDNSLEQITVQVPLIQGGEYITVKEAQRRGTRKAIEMFPEVEALIAA